MDVFGSRKPREIRFSDHVTRLLTKVDYRRADFVEEREAIYRLRYKAYLREGTISADSSGTFSDPYDKTDNAYLFGLHIGGQLASSLRLHPASRERPECPSLDVFPEYLQPELDAGKVLIEFNPLCSERTAFQAPSWFAVCDASALYISGRTL